MFFLFNVIFKKYKLIELLTRVLVDYFFYLLFTHRGSGILFEVLHIKSIYYIAIIRSKPLWNGESVIT